MEYNKPHRTYEEQVELLVSRGLTCEDKAASARLLHRIGYYRLSAYCYPMRKLLPEGERGQSSVQYRLQEFEDGYSIDDAYKLYSFDKSLRLHVLDGIEAFEVALRVQVAHILGKRDPFGHLNIEALDYKARTIQRSGQSRHDEWLGKWDRHLTAASSEDFVKHYLQKYDGQIPIWVATEIIDLGSLVRLFGLMRNDDRNKIARFFGVKTGRTMDTWLLGLNTIRNTCAHHSRLWNRKLNYAVPLLEVAEVGPDLHHLEHIEERRKLYAYVAVLAYMLRSAHPETRWPTQLREKVRKGFPELHSITPETAMAFPEDWESQPLWRHT